MPDLKLILDEQHSGKAKEEVLTLLDAEVDRFSTWMAALPDTRARGALSNPERALLKTYLVQKLTGKIDGVV